MQFVQKNSTEKIAHFSGSEDSITMIIMDGSLVSINAAEELRAYIELQNISLCFIKNLQNCQVTTFRQHDLDITSLKLRSRC